MYALHVTSGSRREGQLVLEEPPSWGSVLGSVGASGRQSQPPSSLSWTPGCSAVSEAPLQALKLLHKHHPVRATRPWDVSGAPVTTCHPRCGTIVPICETGLVACPGPTGLPQLAEGLQPPGSCLSGSHPDRGHHRSGYQGPKAAVAKCPKPGLRRAEMRSPQGRAPGVQDQASRAARPPEPAGWILPFQLWCRWRPALAAASLQPLRPSPQPPCVSHLIKTLVMASPELIASAKSLFPRSPSSQG